MSHPQPSSDLPTLAEFRSLLTPESTVYPRGTTLYRVGSHPLAFVAGDGQALISAHHEDIALLLAQRSNLDRRPVDRVSRTRELLRDLHFGHPEQAELAARRLWDIHSRIVTTRSDGTTVRATDPDLLGLVLVVGLLAAATWYALMTTTAGRHRVQRHTDELFAEMWPDVAAYRAGLGVPPDLLPADPAAAVAWAMDLLAQRWTDDEDARKVAGVAVGLTEGYLAERFPERWARSLSLPASVFEHAVAASAALTLRAPVADRQGQVAGRFEVDEGLLTCHTIRAALAVVPDEVVEDLIATPD